MPTRTDCRNRALFCNAGRGTVASVPLSILAPSLCWGCGSAAGGHALCRSCRGLLRWAERVAEPACGVPAWAPVAYDGPARALVRRAEVPRRPRAGRRAGGGDRGGGARRPAGGRARARAAVPRGRRREARLQPGRGARPRAVPCGRACPVHDVLERRGRLRRDRRAAAAARGWPGPPRFRALRLGPAAGGPGRRRDHHRRHAGRLRADAARCRRARSRGGFVRSHPRDGERAYHRRTRPTHRRTGCALR